MDMIPYQTIVVLSLAVMVLAILVARVILDARILVYRAMLIGSRRRAAPMGA